MNPILLIALPYLLSAAMAFAGAWWIQGVRLEAARNDLVAYKQAATAEAQKATEKHQQINQEVSDGWAKTVTALRERYTTRRVLPAAAGQASAVPDATSEPDDRAAESATGATGLAPPVSRVSCAADALQVLFLQSWIRQVGEE